MADPRIISSAQDHLTTSLGQGLRHLLPRSGPFAARGTAVDNVGTEPPRAHHAIRDAHFTSHRPHKCTSCAHLGSL